MDNEGEDSGLEFPDNNLVDEFNQQQLEFLPQEIDEGIVLDGNQSINQQQHHQQQFLIPQHLQLQQQQFQQDVDPGLFQLDGQDFVFVQQEGQGLNFMNPVENLLPPPDDFVNQQVQLPPYVNVQQQEQEPEQVIVGGAVGGHAVEIIDLGDDNNNDRPDDLNNNTTDPEMQMRQLQIQQQQQQINQQQQQRPAGGENEQNNIPTAIVNVALTEFPPIILENGKPKEKRDKKDKRKKKKKKKRNRFNVVDGSISIKEEGVEKGKENGVNDENDEPENVEIEYVPEKLELSVFDPMYKAFANVFENFRISDLGARSKFSAEDDSKPKPEDLVKALSKVPKIEDDEDDEKKDEEKPKISKKA